MYSTYSGMIYTAVSYINQVYSKLNASMLPACKLVVPSHNSHIVRKKACRKKVFNAVNMLKITSNIPLHIILILYGTVQNHSIKCSISENHQ